MEPPICLNCGRKKVTRPRGLCWRCFYSPGVKEQFPLRSKVGVAGSAPKRTPEPTTARPGTEAKLRVLIGRAERGETLYHPDDY